MRWSGSGCTVGMLWIMLAQPAAAQEAGASQSAVLLVMESTGGLRAASALRSALNAQRGVRVISLADVSDQTVQPAAILTIGAMGTRVLNVVYWSLAGQRDALSAPAPARADQLDAVVLALASALLERHRAELTGGTASAGGTGALALAPYATGVGSLRRPFPRLNVALRFEDF